MTLHHSGLYTRPLEQALENTLLHLLDHFAVHPSPEIVMTSSYGVETRVNSVTAKNDIVVGCRAHVLVMVEISPVEAEIAGQYGTADVRVLAQSPPFSISQIYANASRASRRCWVGSGGGSRFCGVPLNGARLSRRIILA